MKFLRRLSILVVPALAAGCASSPDPLACAAVGGLLGSGGGAYAGSETPGRSRVELRLMQ